ncbi:MAG: hypothetical protein IPH31_07230 [Lewinellaceae bacterium]|nr:hypothetical protein [Lewinellaceae bacterium]
MESKLTSLDGLENLEGLYGGDFGIWANPLLTSLEDLEHLTSVERGSERSGRNEHLQQCPAFGMRYWRCIEHLIHQRTLPTLIQ